MARKPSHAPRPATTRHATAQPSPSTSPAGRWATRIVAEGAEDPQLLLANPRNWRIHPAHQRHALQQVLDRVGWVQSVIVNRTTGHLVDGHLRVEMARELGEPAVPVHYVELSPEEEALVLATLDPLAGLATSNDELLAELRAAVPDFDFEQLLPASAASGSTGPELLHVSTGALRERFLVPPFSVLNAREGWWQERKRAWRALGIQSELGRSASVHGVLHNVDHMKKFGGQRGTGDGTSIFDPVLTELAYRWFCPAGGQVLDPFAGGSVRGAVAGCLGLSYTGMDLSERQVIANREQWPAIKRAAEGLQLAPAEAQAGEEQAAKALPSRADLQALTPVEQRGAYWLKRDDLFTAAGVRGGKARTCWQLAQGAKGLVTAGSRASPQVNIVAHIAQALGVPCRVHTPAGEASPEVLEAVACGAERVEQRPGHNSVIVARAREDADQRKGWRLIPFGMECQEAVEATRAQVHNLPAEVTRLVVPVGSGMSLAGILWGLLDAGRELPVLGVVVGADPIKRLDRWAPEGWATSVQLVQSGEDYHAPAPTTQLEGVQLDPHYEAKCLPHLQPGDCLWCVGLRATARPSASSWLSAQAVDPRWIAGDSRGIAKACAGLQADLIMSCPPYADLEVYSDDPADISRLGYPEFQRAYRQIISEACSLLRQDRFACWVVGDVRDKRGHYRGFVGDTVEAFRAAGLQLYNEAILVTPVGSLPLRAGRHFDGGRKLEKAHQNVLVFLKGDAKRAAEACRSVAAEVEQALAELPAQLEDASA